MSAPMARHEADGVITYCFPHLRAVGVSHAVSTRLGGVSTGPFASLNLSYSVGDDENNVAANRRAFYGSVGLAEDCVVSTYQVHGTNVACVSRASRGRGSIQPGSAIPASDALITADPDTYLFMRYADCVPILLCDPVKRVVGLVHAGWKGTLANIAGITVQTMSRLYGCCASHLLAAVGPAIGPCHYAVGDDVAAEVRRALPFWPAVLRNGEGGSFFLDLPEANQRLLVAAGLTEANISCCGLCTACHTDQFYSHRAQHGRTGRFGVLIGWPVP